MERVHARPKSVNCTTARKEKAIELVRIATPSASPRALTGKAKALSSAHAKRALAYASAHAAFMAAPHDSATERRAFAALGRAQRALDHAAVDYVFGVLRTIGHIDVRGLAPSVQP